MRFIRPTGTTRVSGGTISRPGAGQLQQALSERGHRAAEDTPWTSGISTAHLVRTGSKVEPAKGYAARFTSTYFRATVFLFLSSPSTPSLFVPPG